MHRLDYAVVSPKLHLFLGSTALSNYESPRLWQLPAGKMVNSTGESIWSKNSFMIETFGTYNEQFYD